MLENRSHTWHIYPIWFDSVQAQLLPFGKALKAFLERVTSASAQPNAAAAELNDKSTRQVMEFVKTLAQATNAYPPARAENVTFVLRYDDSVASV